jgi:Uma2 family endonuclease
MNAPVLLSKLRPRISAANLFHMIDKGIIDPQAKFELVEGEIVHMSPQGPLHQELQRWLAKRLERSLGDRFWVAPGATLILLDDTMLDPDICIYPLGVSAKDLTGEKTTLVIEIAVSSRSYDLGQKAGLYSRMGVPELWVVDANARTTHVHRGPQDGGWRDISAVRFEDSLSPVADVTLSVRIADAG